MCLSEEDGGGAFIWIEGKGRAFPSVEAAQSAHEKHLRTSPRIRKALAFVTKLHRYSEFLWARRGDDGSAAARSVMERYVARLLVATWTRVTGLPAFVVNDNALADVVLCLNTKVEAYLGIQVKTCRGDTDQLVFGDVHGYTGLLVLACIRSTLEFLPFSGKDLDGGPENLAVRTLLL